MTDINDDYNNIDTNDLESSVEIAMRQLHDLNISMKNRIREKDEIKSKNQFLQNQNKALKSQNESLKVQNESLKVQNDILRNRNEDKRISINHNLLKDYKQKLDSTHDEINDLTELSKFKNKDYHINNWREKNEEDKENEDLRNRVNELDKMCAFLKKENENYKTLTNIIDKDRREYFYEKEEYKEKLNTANNTIRKLHKEIASLEKIVAMYNDNEK